MIVGGIPTPLNNMSSSIGMMKFPTEWENHPVMFQSPPTSILYIYIYVIYIIILQYMIILCILYIYILYYIYIILY